MIYCYTKPNQMSKHTFSDDVAVVKAISKHSACKKFSYLYNNVKTSEIKRIKIKYDQVTILTDY